MSQAIRQPPPPVPSSAKTRVILRGQGLKKTFKMGESTVVVLKHADLALHAGEFVAIEGRSGSGKSTLLHILGALDDPDAGAVEFDGVNLTALGGNARSRVRNTQFGFVFQFYHLLPELNVMENTLLAPMIENSWLAFRSKKSQLKARAAAVLEQRGLGHRVKHRPNHLSGAERQRVAIARAL